MAHQHTLPLEFSLTTSPNGAFSLKSPTIKTINHGTLSGKHLRVYKVKNKTATVTENNETRKMTLSEQTKVEAMVTKMTEGLNHALMDLFRDSQDAPPLQKLENNLALLKQVLAGRIRTTNAK